MYLCFEKKPISKDYKIVIHNKYSEIDEEICKYYIEFEKHDLLSVIEEYFTSKGHMTEDDIKELCYIHKKILEHKKTGLRIIFPNQVGHLLYPYVNNTHNHVYFQKILDSQLGY